MWLTPTLTPERDGVQSWERKGSLQDSELGQIVDQGDNHEFRALCLRNYNTYVRFPGKKTEEQDFRISQSLARGERNKENVTNTAEQKRGKSKENLTPHPRLCKRNWDQTQQTQTLMLSVLNSSTKRQFETKEKIYFRPLSFGVIHYAAIVTKQFLLSERYNYGPRNTQF